MARSKASSAQDGLDASTSSAQFFVEPMTTRGRSSQEKNGVSSSKPESPVKALAQVEAGSSSHPAENSSTPGDISDGDPPGYVPPPPAKSDSKLDKPSGKRNFEELEDIVFANPLSFKSMAWAIAATRGITLMVANDRTHKVTSAFMHICCVNRSSGCPLVLKLIKAKEGGWLMKSSKATDCDSKQRSNYRCRHPPGSAPEVPSADGKATKLPPTSSHPVPGAKPKAARKKLKAFDSGNEEDMNPPRPDGPPNRPRTSMDSISLPTTSKKGDESDSDNLLQPPSGDRALAPPFDRPLDRSVLIANKITPALTREPPPPITREPPTLHHFAKPSDERAHGPFPFPDEDSAGPSSDRHFTAPPPLPCLHPADALTPLTSHPPAHSLNSHLTDPYLLLPPPPAPLIPPESMIAQPIALPEWTKLLTALDPELASLAPTFASPALAVTPESFFSEDEEMRLALLDMLEIGIWPKLKLKTKLKSKGLEVWKALKRGASGDGSSAGNESRVAMVVDSTSTSLEVSSSEEGVSYISADDSIISSGEGQSFDTSLSDTTDFNLPGQGLPAHDDHDKNGEVEKALYGEPLDVIMNENGRKAIVHPVVAALQREESAGAWSEPMDLESREASCDPSEILDPQKEMVEEETEGEVDMDLSDDSNSQVGDEEVLQITPIETLVITSVVTPASPSTSRTSPQPSQPFSFPRLPSHPVLSTSTVQPSSNALTASHPKARWKPLPPAAPSPPITREPSLDLSNQHTLPPLRPEPPRPAASTISSGPAPHVPSFSRQPLDDYSHSRPPSSYSRLPHTSSKSFSQSPHKGPSSSRVNHPASTQSRYPPPPSPSRSQDQSQGKLSYERPAGDLRWWM